MNAYAMALRNLEREREMPEMLAEDALTPLQGQMVSGHYVNPSWTQGLDKLARAYMARKGLAQNDQKTTDLVEGRQKALVDALRGNAPPELLRKPGYEEAPLSQRIGAVDPEMGIQLTIQEQQRQAAAEQQRAMAEYAAQLRAEEGEKDRAFRASEGEANRAARIQASQGGASTPYYTPVYGADGVYSFNNRAGTATPLSGVGGAPLVRSTDDPGLQGQIAGAKKGAQVTAEAGAQAAIDLPETIAKADQAIKLVDQMLNHPGFESSVGMKGPEYLFGLRETPISGSEGAGFETIREQLGGQQFLQAFESLKGGGQITEVEGTKATNAIARMQTSQSEKDFKIAAQDFLDVIKAGRERAAAKAGMVGAGGPTPGKQRYRFNPQTGQLE